MSEQKKLISKLPQQLRTALSKFPLTKPDTSVPKFIMDRVYGENEDFSLELNETEQIEIAEWAFEKSERTLPDSMEDATDYIKQIGIFASLVVSKMFSTNYDSGDLKPCELYQKNEKVTVVIPKDRKKLNKKCSKIDSEPEKGAIYAKHFGIEEDFEALSQFEQKLFYWYCFANDSKNTQVGKK